MRVYTVNVATCRPRPQAPVCRELLRTADENEALAYLATRKARLNASGHRVEYSMWVEDFTRTLLARK